MININNYLRSHLVDLCRKFNFFDGPWHIES